MPLFRKKRSDATDGSSLSHSSTFSVGRLGSKKRQSNNNGNTNLNKAAVVPEAKKSNNGSCNQAAVASHNDEETVLSGRLRKISSSSYPSEGRHVPLSLMLSADEQGSSSSYPSEGRHVPIPLGLSVDEQDRSYGSSDVSLNTALSTVVVEKHGRCSPSYTPLKPADSIENQLYNLSAITDDILTAAAETAFAYLSIDQACFVRQTPSVVLI